MSITREQYDSLTSHLVKPFFGRLSNAGHLAMSLKTDAVKLDIETTVNT